MNTLWFNVFQKFLRIGLGIETPSWGTLKKPLVKCPFFSQKETNALCLRVGNEDPYIHEAVQYVPVDFRFQQGKIYVLPVFVLNENMKVFIWSEESSQSNFYHTIFSWNRKIRPLSKYLRSVFLKWLQGIQCIVARVQRQDWLGHKKQGRLLEKSRKNDHTKPLDI